MDTQTIIYILIGLILFYFFFSSDSLMISSDSKIGSNEEKEDEPQFFSSCRKLTPEKLISQVLNNHNFQKSNTNWKFHITCKNDYTNGKIKLLTIRNPKQKIMGISGKWTLGSKHKLWMALESYYGRQGALKIMPTTYVLDRDLNLLMKEFNPKKIYFLKKDIQRQKGLALTSDLEQIKHARKQGYVVVQEYLRHPYLYFNYKTNLRIYIIMVCQGQGRKQAYIYQDGIISYTGNPYREPSTLNKSNDLDDSFDSTVSSFYLSQPLYNRGFPITWEKFRMDLPYQGRQVWNDIRQLLNKVMRASHPKMCQFQFKYGNTSFELFGVDIFLDQALRPWLVEINVGPGMSPNDQRDHVMRQQLYQDMFGIMGLINSSDSMNKFKLFWQN